MNGQMRLVLTANQDVVGRVTTLADRVEKALVVRDARERSSLKGRPFQDAVQAEVEAVVGPLGDEVRCVADEYGAVRSLKMAGDFVITLNPHETGGRELRIAVEAKTGPLNPKEAHVELERVARNRDAVAAILVFDGAEDAPLGGRHFGSYAGAKFSVVLDSDDPNPL